MDSATLAYDLISWGILGISIILIIGMAIFFLRDGVQQAPRFGKALLVLMAVFLVGAIVAILWMITGWYPLFVIGGGLTLVPLFIVTYVAGGMIREASQDSGGMGAFVVGVFVALFIGIVLRILKGFLV